MIRTNKLHELPISAARAIDAAAASQIKSLLNRYGVMNQSTKRIEIPPTTSLDHSQWAKEFKVIYNPSILWRPQGGLAEKDQFAVVGYEEIGK